MTLIKGRRPVAEDCRHLDDDQPPPAAGRFTVSLSRWKNERESLVAGGRAGVRLLAGEPPDGLAGDLGSLALVAIEFPVFRDGRGYSYARRLREEFGYRGEIRAIGDVLRDQLVFMERCGFDAMELAPHQEPQDALKAFSEFSEFYQPDTHRKQPLYRRRK